MSDREESPADNGADVAPDDVAASDGDDDAASAKRSHSRSRTRSHSRSPKRHHSKTSSSHHHHRRHHRSRSRSRSPRHHRSRSPGGRRRHFGSREDPEPTRCLGIFGMSLYTSERDLKDIFGQYGPIESVQIVHDHPTGRSRGFGFVYFENTEDAIEAKDRVNGTDIDGQRVRIDFSITKRAHTPTPGQYMGRSHDRRRSNGFRSGGGGGRPSYRSDYGGGGGYDRGYDHRGSGDYRGRSPYDGYYDDHRRRSSRNSYDRDYN